MAFDFVMNFAKDNDLPVYEGCVLPDRSTRFDALSARSARCASWAGKAKREGSPARSDSRRAARSGAGILRPSP